MTSLETIQSWRWRIVRVGKKQGEFATLVGYSQNGFSEILNEKKNITASRLDEINAKLIELEIEAGVIDAAR